MTSAYPQLYSAEHREFASQCLEKFPTAKYEKVKNQFNTELNVVDMQYFIGDVMLIPFG